LLISFLFLAINLQLITLGGQSRALKLRKIWIMIARSRKFLKRKLIWLGN